MSDEAGITTTPPPPPPPPGRRGRRRRRLSVAIAIVATLVIAFVVFNKSRFLPNRVATYVNEHYLAGTPFRFQSGRISGDLINHIVINNPVLRYHSDEASFNVFRADRIEVDYRLLDVLRFNLVVDDLRLDDVSVQIRKDADGNLVLPIPSSAGGEGGKSGAAFSGRVDVQRFEIDGLQVLLGDGERELRVRDVNLAGSFDLDGGVGRLRVDTGSAYLANTDTPVSSFRLDVEHDAGAIHVNDFLVRLDRSFVMATGGYRDGALERLQLVFNPISLDEVHSMGLIPDLHGQFGGNVILEGPLDSLGISGQVTGEGLGLAMRGFHFDGRVAPDAVNLEHVDGDVFGSRLKGSFRYQLRGDHNWVFDGDARGVDLTQGFIPGRGLPRTELDGHVRVEHVAAAESYLFDADLDSALVDTYRAAHTEIRGSWTPVGGLRMDEWTMERPGYTTTMWGTLTPQSVVDFLFQVHGDDLGYFWDFAHVPPIAAKVDVSGRVQGHIDSLRVNLNGEARDVGFLFAAVDSGRVQADVRGIRSPAPQASVALTGKRITIGNRTFTAPHLRLDVQDGVTSVRDVTFTRGDTTFTADFDVTPGGADSLAIVLNHAAIVHPGEVWRLTSPATFRYTPRELSVDSLVLASPSGWLGVSGEYSEPRGTMDARGWGRNVDLAIVADAMGLGVDVTGTGEFHIEARGAVDDPKIDATAELYRGRIDSLAFDRLAARATYARGEVRLHRAVVVEAGDSISVDGWWRPGKGPVALVRDGADWEKPFEATFRADGYTVSSLTRALHHRLGLGGALRGVVRLSGSPAQPKAAMAFRVEPRPGETLALPAAEVEADYAAGALTLATVHLTGDIDADITGRLPLEFSLLSGASVPRDVPLEVDVELREPKKAVDLARYVGFVTTWRGGFKGRVTVRGTVERPRLGGELTMEGATVQVAGMVERFEHVNARVTFVDNVANLTALTADSDGGGSLRATGSATLDGWVLRNYHVDMFLSDMWLRSIPNVESQQDGHLTVASVEWSDGRRIPNITGALTVKEATLHEVLSNRGGGSGGVSLPTVSPGWVCSIDLNAENNVWIKDPDLRIELGGKLILKRDDQGLYLRGNLSVLRGQYAVYGNKFRIIDGTLDFSTASLRPEVHINAYTPHRVDSGLERRIYLSLDWPRDKKEPELSLSYDEPGYYESDIWRMLGGSVAGGLAANTLERVLNEQMSDVTIDVEQRQSTRASQRGTPEQEMMIGVGKYLWEDVYLRYRQGLTLTTSREVEVEYRLSNMFLIRSELIRHARRSYVGANRQTLDEFNLDIRLRWEF